ncbi:MAG: endolytic transglycosylase MltG [Clostridiales bacterium]|nr:endolytic transglycosylase MltG [Clostridiales bacterium]
MRRISHYNTYFIERGLLMSRVERAEAKLEREAKQAAQRERSDQAGKTNVKRKKKKKKGGCLWLLVLVLAILVGFGGYYTLGLAAVDPNSDEQVVVDIPSGTGASAIVDILDNAGLVKNRFCAKVNARIGHYNGLQANTYIFSPSMSFREIMNAINNGSFDYLSKESVEVKDGARLQQVAEAVSEQLPYTAEEILAVWSDTGYLNELIDKYWFLTDDILDDDVMFPLEGYLYADTYFVTDNMTIEGFTEMCLDRMDEELSARKDDIEASGFTVHELLTLTSIVTKEARADDQPKVAGVFMNRLEQGMSLGSDVTVCYIFQEDRVELKVSQLESTNPYNTRKYAGLPPGPICQVIGDAIDAVLHYEASDNIFFFADEDGVVHYYKTQADFEQGIEDEGLLKDDDSDEG